MRKEVDSLRHPNGTFDLDKIEKLGETPLGHFLIMELLRPLGGARVSRNYVATAVRQKRLWTFPRNRITQKSGHLGGVPKAVARGSITAPAAEVVRHVRNRTEISPRYTSAELVNFVDEGDPLDEFSDEPRHLYENIFGEYTVYSDRGIEELRIQWINRYLDPLPQELEDKFEAEDGEWVRNYVQDTMLVRGECKNVHDEATESVHTEPGEK